MASHKNSLPIVTNGLVLHLDAANPKSYSKSGTTWFDLSGNGNDGTLINGPTYSSSNGGSILFDGSNDYASVSNNVSIVNNNITLNIWAYPTSIGVYKTLISSEPVLSTQNGYGIRQRIDNVWWFVVGREGNGESVQTNLNQNMWVNLSGTYNGSTMILYKNGISVGSTSSARTINFSNNLTIGILPTTLNDPYAGNVSLVQIYNRALSTSEVLQNYNAAKNRFGL